MAEGDKGQQIEAPEVRDADEVAEERARVLSNLIPSNGWPIGANGRPMALVVGGCSDKVPTVQYGNVVIGPVQIYRFIDDEGTQARIDEGRITQRETEFIVGVERRLLQWALDPQAKIASPVSGDDAFASPPPGYDPAAAPQHPGDAAGAQAVAVNHTEAAATPAVEGDASAQVG